MVLGPGAISPNGKVETPSRAGRNRADCVFVKKPSKTKQVKNKNKARIQDQDPKSVRMERTTSTAVRTF